MLLILLLDISFPQALQRHLELCQCHSLLQSGGDLPPGTPAIVLLRPFPELTRLIH